MKLQYVEEEEDTRRKSLEGERESPSKGCAMILLKLKNKIDDKIIITEII